MQTTLAITTLVMGLAGGPHCIAMCGAACSGVASHGPSKAMQFHLGRVLGYSSLGAAAAASIAAMAWLAAHVAIIKPLWVFMHLGMLVWGLWMMIYARQPQFADSLSNTLGRWINSTKRYQPSAFMMGYLWALMPCGLLYSALMVSAISGNLVLGAICMMSFAIGSAMSLMVGGALWFKVQNGTLSIGKWRASEPISMRLAGASLCAFSIWAIYMDITHGNSLWCIQ